MSDKIIYRPYKTQIWPLIFTIPIGILAFLGAGYYLSYSGIAALCLIGVGILCIWLNKALYDSSKKTIFLEPKGLRIVSGSYNDYRYISWESLTHAYYAKSFKGHLFLVLSPRALSSKEIKRFANHGATSSQICFDCVVVIYIDILQNTSQLAELIDKYVVNVAKS